MGLGSTVETVACDFCGSAEATPVARQTDLLHRTTEEFFTIVRCADCGLQYTIRDHRRTRWGAIMLIAIRFMQRLRGYAASPLLQLSAWRMVRWRQLQT